MRFEKTVIELASQTSPCPNVQRTAKEQTVRAILGPRTQARALATKRYRLAPGKQLKMRLDRISPNLETAAQECPTFLLSNCYFPR